MRSFIKPNVFISACIEFDSCRFDGSMIADEHVKKLSKIANVSRVCPEMSIGLGAPRNSLRLVEREGEEIKLLESKTGIDYSEKMNQFSINYLEKLKSKDIDGFILKAKSPSCGFTSVKVYFDIGKSYVKNAKNPGFFGGHILEYFPNYPIEDERRISNYNIRERFYTELYTLARYRDIKTRLKSKELGEFHANNKYLFMGYNQSLLKKMGNVVANHDHLKMEVLFDEYEVLLRNILAKEQTTEKRINVLTHIYGYFKNEINVLEKEYYFDMLQDYLDNKKPYSSLLALLESWAIRFNQTYLIKQTIFEPFPKELLTVLDSGKNV